MAVFFLLFLFLCSFSLVLLSNVVLISLSWSCFSTIFCSCCCKWYSFVSFCPPFICSSLLLLTISLWFFFLFSCQILLSFLCLVIIFLLYFAPVAVNSTVFSLFCQLFLPLILYFYFSVFPLLLCDDLCLFVSCCSLVFLSCIVLFCFHVVCCSCFHEICCFCFFLLLFVFLSCLLFFIFFSPLVFM